MKTGWFFNVLDIVSNSRFIPKRTGKSVWVRLCQQTGQGMADPAAEAENKTVLLCGQESPHFIK